jgi:hypothetical protein
MTDPVDHARGKQRNPKHLHCPHRDAGKPKQYKVEHEQGTDADPVVLRVNMALDPIVRRATTVFLVVSAFRPSSRYSSAPCQKTFAMPLICGLCGSSAVSHFA